MSSSHPSFNLPRRLSLPAQTADTIRQAIYDGTWKEFLPGERSLCELLNVSRPTVRTALGLLQKDGLIEISHGRRNRLVPGKRTPARNGGRLVGLVTHQPVSSHSPVAYYAISEMRASLAEHGFATEVIFCPQGSAAAQRRKLEDFVRQHRVACLVLISASAELQRWAQARAIPAFVVGSCHRDVQLPAFDFDHRLVCHHAVGVFQRHGHRRLALVIPDSGAAGDLASEQGFREALDEQVGGQAGEGTVIRYDGTARSVCSKLDAIFGTPHAPTGLLVAKFHLVFIVLVHLLKRGLTVPGNVSLIARDHHHMLDLTSPPVAHYALDEGTYARRFSRLILQLLNQGYLPPQPNLLIPKYVAGGTVARSADQL